MCARARVRVPHRWHGGGTSTAPVYETQHAHATLTHQVRVLLVSDMAGWTATTPAADPTKPDPPVSTVNAATGPASSSPHRLRVGIRIGEELNGVTAAVLSWGDAAE